MMISGLVDGGGRLAVLPRLAVVRPRPLLRVYGEAGRRPFRDPDVVRVRAEPLVLLEPLVPLAVRGRLVPVRARAALLGARVAMLPTVARNAQRA
jgi:hypothetical protein